MTAIMPSSTSPVPLIPNAAAYVGSGGRFHGAKAKFDVDDGADDRDRCCGRIEPGWRKEYRSARNWNTQRSRKRSCTKIAIANATWMNIAAVLDELFDASLEGVEIALMWFAAYTQGTMVAPMRLIWKINLRVVWVVKPNIRVSLFCDERVKNESMDRFERIDDDDEVVVVVELLVSGNDAEEDEGSGAGRVSVCRSAGCGPVKASSIGSSVSSDTS